MSISYLCHEQNYYYQISQLFCRNRKAVRRHRDTLYYAIAGKHLQGGFSVYENIRAWLDRVAAEPGHVPVDA